MDPRGPRRKPSPRDGDPGRSPRRLSRPRACALDALAALAGVLLAFVAYAQFAPLEDPRSLLPPGGTVVLASDGTILWRDTAAGVRIPVALDSVSPAVIEATIAAEDQRFWSHPGVDPLAVFRAATRLPWERSGASTITQQVARRLYLGDEPLMLRKAREAQIATQLEARYSKDEILELYLNSAYYGRGAYGIEAAARVYFGVSATNLDLARAAFLAGLTQSPAAGEDAGNTAFARQRYVLNRMAATGTIDTADRDRALAAELGLRPALEPAIAPHFVAFALDEARRTVPGFADAGGLIVETTLDPVLEAAAEQQARLQLDRLEKNDAGNVAVVVLDPRDGRILVMAGNVTTNGPGSEYNMAVEPRQPGSALKPFLYSLGLDAGFTAASPLLDVPSSFPTASGGAYAPQNHDRRYRGIVTLRTALGSSLNVPAVGVLEELGPDRLADRLRELGIDTAGGPEQHDLALALGSSEVSLLRLAAAYGALATGGVQFEPFAVVRIRDTAGAAVYEHGSETGRRVMAAENAFVISDILSDDNARIPGFGVGSILQLPFPAAVKTGTTTEFRDNWTIGYTPRQVAGVWVGNVDNRSMKDVSGVDGAAPVWAEIMKAAREVQGASTFQAPATVARADVCSPTGLLPGDACPGIRREWFIRGTEPAEREHYYVRETGTGRTLVDPPPSARPWLRDAGYPLTVDATGGSGPLAVVQPREGDVLYMAPELPRQEFVIRVGCPAGVAELTVLIDGSQVASSDDGCPDRLVATLAPGAHSLQAVAMEADGTQVYASSKFEVRTR